MLNVRELEYCNADLTYTGKGLRVAFLEFGSSPDLSVFSNIAKLPIDMPTSGGPFDHYANGNLTHSLFTVSVLHFNRPDVEIFLVPQTNAGLTWIAENNIHIVNASVMNINGDDSLEDKLVGLDCLTICAAGNDSDNHTVESITAQREMWTSITAMHLNLGEEEPTYAPYNSNGLGVIDHAGFAAVFIPNYNGVLYGSSIAGPWVVLLMVEFYERYKEKMGRFPTRLEALRFMKINSKKIMNDFIKEGHGLLVLPDWDTYDFGISLILNSKEINVNGVKKTIAIAPYTVLNNTVVQLTFIREFGITVNWDGVLKQVTIIRGSNTVILTIGSREISVNGYKKIIAVAPFINAGNTMVQLTVIRELGLSVFWDAEYQTIIVNK